MRIKTIKIENYRGILNEEIEFNEQVNVFIGGNGAGKTTLLEAIFAPIVQITTGLIAHTLKEYEVSINDINYNKKYTSILLGLDVSSIHFKLSNKEKINPTLPLFTKIGQLEESISEKEYKTQTAHFKIAFKKSIQEKNFSLPIIKYYPTNRSTLKYKDTPTKIYINPKLESWSNAVQNDISYSNFFKWFSEQEIQELRLQRDEDSFEHKSPTINNVRMAIQKAFKKLNGKDYLIKSEAIKRNGTNNLVPTLALQEKGSKIKEILDNKSAGEKAIITLIADIAYNLSIAHDFTEDDDFLKSSGIVLIDEIEAHLHPNWQRKIIPLLTELFPNIQFFITTHSPQVIASVNSENIFVGEDFKFEKINIKTKGTDSNALLKYVFDATERPQKYLDLIATFREMMDDEKNPEDLQLVIDEIANLEKEDNGTDVSQLMEELNLELEAYKFDLEHEVD